MSEAPIQIGKVLVIAGVVLVGLGLILMLGSRFSFFSLGKLPGDIAYKGRTFSLYFPIVTSLLISVVLTLLVWLFSFFSRR
ncbi:MAG TPA: DUF2905 domain-containing protein [Terriglobia bacterium]|nr:DUF2905 domain-containing protein [Terriglobia bacterium]